MPVSENHRIKVCAGTEENGAQAGVRWIPGIQIREEGKWDGIFQLRPASDSLLRNSEPSTDTR